MKMKKAPNSILIVDDDSPLREMLSAKFKGKGYQISIADTAFKAIRYAKTELPDVILIDVAMPELDGMKLVEELRKHEETLTPFIILTSQRQSKKSFAQLSDETGDYLAKPFSLSELAQRIENMLQTQDAKRYQLAKAVHFLKEMHSANLRSDPDEYRRLTGELFGIDEAKELAVSASNQRCRCILKAGDDQREYIASTKGECAKAANMFGFGWEWTCD